MKAVNSNYSSTYLPTKEKLEKRDVLHVMLGKNFCLVTKPIETVGLIPQYSKEVFKTKSTKIKQMLNLKKVTFLLLKGYTLNDMGLLLPIKGSQ